MVSKNYGHMLLSQMVIYSVFGSLKNTIFPLEFQQKRINDAEKIIYKLIDSEPDFETHDSPNTGEDNPFLWAASKWLSRA